MEVLPVIPIEQAGELLLAAIASIIGGSVLNAPITTFLVSILKRVDTEGRVSSDAWAVAAGAFVTVAVWLSRYFGVEVTITNVFQLVVVAGPLVLNLLTTLAGSSALYQAARKAHTPLIGYQRPA